MEHPHYPDSDLDQSQIVMGFKFDQDPSSHIFNEDLTSSVYIIQLAKKHLIHPWQMS